MGRITGSTNERTHPLMGLASMEFIHPHSRASALQTIKQIFFDGKLSPKETARNITTISTGKIKYVGKTSVLIALPMQIGGILIDGILLQENVNMLLSELIILGNFWRCGICYPGFL